MLILGADFLHCRTYHGIQKGIRYISYLDYQAEKIGTVGDAVY